MLRLLLLLFTLFFAAALQAQTADPYKKRYSFAQSYFGVELNCMPHYQPGRFLNTDGALQSFARPAFVTPNLVIGATHFWGHADFYASIATRTIHLKAHRAGTPEVDNHIDVITGMKIYPFALVNKTVRPYVGLKFAPLTYRQSTGQPYDTQLTRVKSMVDIGIGYTSRHLYAYLGYTRIINPTYTIALSKTRFEPVPIMPHFISLGVHYKIETTKGAMYTPFNQLLHKELSATNRFGFFVAAGPSSAFPTCHSSYLTEHWPYLDQRVMPNVFPELAVGYHFSKTDLNVALAGRFYHQDRSAFDVSQRLSRYSLVLESYKFLGDFHGFCPFLGGGLSYEHVRFEEAEAEEVVDQFNRHQVTPVFTFGWDIRPTRKGDWWLLRTNLRYTPFLTVEHRGTALSLQHVEFNFIQFVFYPQRLAQKKRLDPR